jgi:hypothetical protein
LRLTVDLGSPSCCAAAVKLLVSTTLANTTISFRSTAAVYSSTERLKAVARRGRVRKIRAHARRAGGV